VRLGWFPVAGTSAGWPIAYLLPAAVIAVFGLASVSRLMRTSMLENLNADYVRTARAKGLGEGQVIGVHVMRNSLIPAVTYLATDLGYLLGGTVIIEGIFNLPGVGNLLFQAIRSHEGPTVVGVSTALIVIFLLTSIVVDLLHALLDPRIRR
jgi:oligopeptide transport system permease protein